MLNWFTRYLDKPEQQHLIKILEVLKTRSLTETINPSPENLFRALELIEEPRVIILGQDPYPDSSYATGVAFGVPSATPKTSYPQSLKNIFRELKEDITETNSRCDLLNWVQQGVLLLNCCLTIVNKKPGSHKILGWEKITDKIIKSINEQYVHRVFILWGNYAQSKIPLIDPTKHLILSSVHPSPLSASRGFFGSKPFSKTNDYLKAHGFSQIDW